MLKIPAKISDDFFDSHIKRGTIIRTLYKFENTPKEVYKYFILVSQNVTDNPLVFVITTSNIGFYLKHPSFNNDAISIVANTLPCFPLDTVLDCRLIYPLNRDVLKGNFQVNVLEFCGELPKHLIERVDDVIKSSRHISIKNKKLILGDNYQTRNNKTE